jgi:hypothetical protein
VASYTEKGNDLLVFIKSARFVDQLSDYQLLMKYSASELKIEVEFSSETLVYSQHQTRPPSIPTTHTHCTFLK